MCVIFLKFLVSYKCLTGQLVLLAVIVGRGTLDHMATIPFNPKQSILCNIKFSLQAYIKQKLATYWLLRFQGNIFYWPTAMQCSAFFKSV